MARCLYEGQGPAISSCLERLDDAHQSARRHARTGIRTPVGVNVPCRCDTAHVPTGLGLRASCASWLLPPARLRDDRGVQVARPAEPQNARRVNPRTRSDPMPSSRAATAASAARLPSPMRAKAPTC
jgi:hypothetical protein